VSYEVTLAGVTVKAADVGEALEVAADLVEAAAVAARRGLLIRCDGQVDEAATELARECLRLVQSGHLAEPEHSPS
jgi:hypothetical protein